MVSLCPLIIFDHLYVSQVKFYSFLYPFSIMTKKGEKMWFLFKIIHVRGINTCICKGELCFILLGGVFTSFVVIGASFSFLYTALVTILLHTLYFMFIYMIMMYVFFTYLYMCCFFSLLIHMFFYVQNLYFCSTHDALMSFV